MQILTEEDTHKRMPGEPVPESLPLRTVVSVDGVSLKEVRSDGHKPFTGDLIRKPPADPETQTEWILHYMIQQRHPNDRAKTKVCKLSDQFQSDCKFLTSKSKNRRNQTTKTCKLSDQFQTDCKFLTSKLKNRRNQSWKLLICFGHFVACPGWSISRKEKVMEPLISPQQRFLPPCTQPTSNRRTSEFLPAIDWWVSIAFKRLSMI